MFSTLTSPLLMLALAVSAMPEPGPRITSDSAEYCSSLAARVSRLPAAEREPSRSLAAEGVRLCGDGQVKSGIAKLRRAVKAAQASP